MTFSTYDGTQLSGQGHPQNQHIFTSHVPAPGDDVVHMNLYVFGFGKAPLERETEIVIEKFKFYP